MVRSVTLAAPNHPNFLVCSKAWLCAGLRRPTTQIADWMSVAKQALTQGPDRFTFIITPKQKPDVLRVRLHYCCIACDFFTGQLNGRNFADSLGILPRDE